MSLFPEGSSTGMNAFSGASKQDDNKPAEEKISSDDKKKEKNEDSPKITLIPSLEDTLAKEALNSEATINFDSITSNGEQAKDFLNSPLVDNNIVPSKENNILEPVPQLPKEEPNKEVFIKQEEKKNETSNNEEPKKAKLITEEFEFPTSVRIAGLTAPEDISVNSHFVNGKIPIISDEKTDEFKSDDTKMINLSDSDMEELEDMNEKYFQEYRSDFSMDGCISLDELLDLAIDKEASDIHFSASSKIAIRINGRIYFIEEAGELTNEQARYLIFSLVQNPLHRKKIFEDRELDCAYEHKNAVNFRVNIFFKRGRIAAVLRIIASHAMTMEQLGLPSSVKNLMQMKQGLLLVTGPTGSGKSTSMQSMLQLINETRVEHILTIEDPIEFLFTSEKSIFSQREIGNDTKSFSNALRAALREDPDIVMIGEMRDAETIRAAMNLSETGHLVISTLHTSSAPQTISRLVSNFPSNEQEQVQSRLADTLLGVLSQRLIPRADRDGRIGIFELMIVNSAIRNIIRTGDMTQIHNAMLAGREDGMVIMENYAEELESQGIVKRENFEHFFRQE